MTYYQFITSYGAEWGSKHRNVVYVCGGSEYVQTDVINILERRLKKTKIGSFRKQTVHMNEFAGNEPNPAFLSSLFDMKVILWQPKMLDKANWSHFIKGLQKGYGVTVIVDGSGELLESFTKVYGKGSPGVVVDCRKFPTDMHPFITLQLRDIKGVKVSEDVIKFLMDIPFDDLFSIFAILNQLRIKDVGVKEVRQYGVFTSNMELIYAKKLLKEGKPSVLKMSFANIDEARFLRFLCSELIRLLRIKTISDRTMVVAQELKIPYKIFKEFYLPLADKLDIQILYNRLHLALTFLRWQTMPGISTLLLVYWR